MHEKKRNDLKEKNIDRPVNKKQQYLFSSDSDESLIEIETFIMALSNEELEQYIGRNFQEVKQELEGLGKREKVIRYETFDRLSMNVL